MAYSKSLEQPPPALRVAVCTSSWSGYPLEPAVREAVLAAGRRLEALGHYVEEAGPAFDYEPWPTWTFTLEDGTRIEQEIVAAHGTPLVGIRWRVLDPAANDRITLSVRPFLSGRDYHALHHENGAFRFDPTIVA